MAASEDAPRLESYADELPAVWLVERDGEHSPAEYVALVHELLPSEDMGLPSYEPPEELYEPTDADLESLVHLDEVIAETEAFEECEALRGDIIAARQRIMEAQCALAALEGDPVWSAGIRFRRTSIGAKDLDFLTTGKRLERVEEYEINGERKLRFVRGANYRAMPVVGQEVRTSTRKYGERYASSLSSVCPDSIAAEVLYFKDDPYDQTSEVLLAQAMANERIWRANRDALREARAVIHEAECRVRKLGHAALLKQN